MDRVDQFDEQSDKSILPNLVRSSLVIDLTYWNDFKEYLIKDNQSKSSITNKICYAKRFHYILETRNASELSRLSPDVKSHAMKALASLSKFLGRYDEWLDIVKKYQLKWSKGGKSIKAFKSIFDSESQGNNLELMIK